MAIMTKKKISPEAVIRKVRHKGAGAIVTFFGTVRARSNGKKVVRLEFEAHSTMAEKALKRIEDEAIRRWGAKKAFIVHSVGKVKAGEITVGIAVSAPHRDTAFQACRYLIDNLKVIVPLWKKEVYPDGEKWIRGKK